MKKRTPKWISSLRFLIFSFVLMYGLALLGVYFSQDRQIYFPPPHSAQPFQVFLENNEGKMGGWVVQQDPKQALVVFGGNAQSLSKMTRPQGLSACTDRTLILFPYRSYEGNPGKPREKDLIADGQAVLKWAKAHYSHVSILGISLGSGVAVGVASQESDLDGLLLGTPYDSLVNVGQDLMPWMLPKILMKDHYNSAARARQIKVPVYILRARGDQLILKSRTDHLKNTFTHTTVEEWVSEGDHDTVWSNPETCDWIKAHT